MASLSKRLEGVYEEPISPLERFTWTEDAELTQRRRRRSKGVRLIVCAATLLVVAGSVALFERV